MHNIQNKFSLISLLFLSSINAAEFISSGVEFKKYYDVKVKENNGEIILTGRFSDVKVPTYLEVIYDKDTQEYSGKITTTYGKDATTTQNLSKPVAYCYYESLRKYLPKK